MSARVSRSVLTAFAAAAALRLVLFGAAFGGSSQRLLTPDSTTYVALAENMAARRGFSSAPPAPELYRTPGYPMFLLLAVGPSGRFHPLLAAGLQLLLGALIAAGTAGLAAKLAGERAGLIAGVIAAVDVVFLEHNFLIVSETLFAGFILTALWLILGRNRLAAAGVALSLGALTRPIGLYMALPFAGLLCLFQAGGARARAGKVLPFLLGAYLLPFCWVARNRAVAGEWVFTSVQGVNLLYRGAMVESLLRKETPESQFQRLMDEAHRQAKDPGEFGLVAERMGRDIILAHPLAFARVFATDFVRLAGGHGLEIAPSLWLKDARYDALVPAPLAAVASVSGTGTRRLLADHPSLGAVLAVYLVFLVILYAGAVWGGVWLWRVGSREAACILASTVGYLALLPLGSQTYHRFRIPFLPALAVLAGVGLSRLWAIFFDQAVSASERGWTKSRSK